MKLSISSSVPIISALVMVSGLTSTVNAKLSISSSPSSSFVAGRTYNAATKIHRMLQDGAGTGADGMGMTDLFCQGFEEAIDLGQELSGENGDTVTTATASCTCDGDIASTILLTCVVDNVCGSDGETQQEICGDVDFTLRISGLWDSEMMMLGENPTMVVDTCFLINNLSFLDEQWCASLSFDIADAAAPIDCTVTYGGRSCTCDIDTDNLCYSWNCSETVAGQPFLAEWFHSSDCAEVDGVNELETGSVGSGGGAVDNTGGDTLINGDSGSTISLTAFLPAMGEIPADAEAELTSNNAPTTGTGASGGIVTNHFGSLNMLAVISGVCALLI